MDDIRLRDLLRAAQELGSMIGQAADQVDGDGAPRPGTQLARLMALFSLYQPAYRPNKPGRN